jgi:ribosomal-protein-alanine N-acetyltransferase
MKPRVRLLAVTPSDERDFLVAVANSRRLHASWVSPAATPERFSSLVQRMQGPGNHGFVLRRVDDDALVGWIEFTNVVRGAFLSAYLGYYAFAGHERQGLMSEGLCLAVRHAFRELKLHRLEANIQPANRASIALVRRCGFHHEGHSPRYLKIRGRWRDHERWAILAS